MISRVFIFILFFNYFSWGRDVSNNFAVERSLVRLGLFQDKFSCTKEYKPIAQCSNIISKLVEDDNKSRILILESRAQSCRSQFEARKYFKNPELLQNAFEVNKFSYLGETTHQSAKECLQSKDPNKSGVISKFYFYTARLNETSSKISQEQFIIDQYLGNKKTECPNPYLLTAANQYCEKAKNCSAKNDLSELSDRVTNEEKLFIETKAKLSKLKLDCATDFNCKEEKSALSAILAGLLNKNPWFVNEDFNNSKNKYAVKSRLKKYFQTAKENLAQQQEKLLKATQCIHLSDLEECPLDEVREVLDLTKAFPKQTSTNPIDKILDNHIELNSCLEESSLDRNRTSYVISDALKTAGVGLFTLGIGSAINAGKIAGWGLSRLALLVGTEAATNVVLSFESWKEIGKSCFANEQKINFQFKDLSQEDVCENTESALSSGNQEKSSCLISAGMAAISTLSMASSGKQVFDLAKKAGSPARVPWGQRANDFLKVSIESRSVASRMATGLEGKSVKVIEHPSMPKQPENIKIVEVEKADGSKNLSYLVPEKLADNTWRATPREFLIDEITGAINANDPAGRDLFEKIAKQKAGQAYFAFFDVGSLGAVNKTFKAGEAAGDKYLKGVADKILQFGEGKVTLARTGGDEFGLIIDEVDAVKTKALIEKIQSEIRKDLKGDAKQVFFEEKVERAKKFREDLKKLQAENPNGDKAEQMAAVRKNIDELARLQQPDVSIGLTQIGHADDLSTLSHRSEQQAKDMKISTALEFGRSAEKYGSKATPKARPNSMYLAPVKDASASPTWSQNAAEAQKALSDVPLLSSLSFMKTTKKGDDVVRFSNISVGRYEDELGRTIYKTEKFITDPLTGSRSAVLSEMPTRGKTGLFDGIHPEGEALIMSHLSSDPDVMLVMPKLKSLKYLNYFEEGSAVGDEVLASVAQVMKSNARNSDLLFKLNGADFLMSMKQMSPAALAERTQKMKEQLKTHPQVVAALNREISQLNAQLAKAQSASNHLLVKELQSRIQQVKNFDFDLQFQELKQNELGPKPQFKDILKKLDDQFNKN